jgi:hypothetical protein
MCTLTARTHTLLRVGHLGSLSLLKVQPRDNGKGWQLKTARPQLLFFLKQSCSWAILQEVANPHAKPVGHNNTVIQTPLSFQGYAFILVTYLCAAQEDLTPATLLTCWHRSSQLHNRCPTINYGCGAYMALRACLNCRWLGLFHMSR